MKKLRVALIVLFAMLMSLALFACNNTGDNGGGTGTDKDKNPAGQVDTLTVDGKIEFHDQQKKAEAEALLANVKITATYENDAEGNPVASKVLTKDDYTADWSGVPFGADGTVNVGNYKLTVTPKADNFYKVTATVEVVVSHNFQKNGELTSCPKDGATVVEQDITDTFSIAAWGKTVTIGKDNKVVKFADGHPDLMTTVGRLEKGMSIKLTGTAKTLATGQTYYFPILGVANLEEGGSFLQRGDNWGIYSNAELPAWNRNPYPDQDSVTTGFPGVEAAELMRGYVSGPITGTSDYATAKKITITWSYSIDCVFEITYEVEGFAARTISIKLPDRQYYHALIYGEQVEMSFTHATTIQSLKLKDAETPKIKAVKVLENKMLSDYYDQFDFGVSYEGNQSGKVNKDMLTVYGSKTAGVKDEDITELEANPTADALAEAGWVNLAVEKMSKNYKSFLVIVTVGNDRIARVLSNPGDLTIIENAVDHAGSNEVTIDETIFITGVNGVEFVNIDAKPTLVVSGYALTLTPSQKTALKATTATHSVAFTVYQNGETKFSGTPTFDGADGHAAISTDGTKMDVVLGITKDTKTVTIKGAQPTDIVVNFTQAAVDNAGVSYTQDTVAGRTITSTMTENYDQKLNEAREVTITYKVGSGIDPTKLRESYKFVVNNSTTYFNAAGNDADNGDRITENKKLMKGIEGMTVKSLTYSGDTITVVYNVPAFDPAAPVSYQFSLLDRKNSDATLVTDYLYYVPQFADNANYSHGFHFARSGYNFYITKAFDDSDLQNGDFATALTFSANAGSNTPADYRTYTYLRPHDLSFAVDAAGVASFTDGALLKDLATVNFYPFGTLNNPEDTDRGAVVVITVDLRTLGLDGKDIAFELDGEDNHYYKTAASANGAIGADKAYTITGDSVVVNDVDPTDCTSEVTSAYEIDGTKTGEAKFYAGLSYTKNEHKWIKAGTADTAATGLEDAFCSQCGAKRFTVSDTNGSYTFEALPALTELENPDKSGDDWWANPTAETALSGNFVIRYTWHNDDANYPGGGAIEMHNEDDKFFGYRTFEADYNPGPDTSELCGGAGTDTHVYKKNGQTVAEILGDNAPEGVPAADWTGDVDVIVYRYGTTLVIDATLKAGQDTYQVTTTITKFTTQDVKIRINGNHFFCSNIKFSVGSMVGSSIKGSVTIGNTVYTYDAADQHVQNLDPDGAWWAESETKLPSVTSDFVVPAGNFIIVWNWDNARDTNWYQDCVIELNTFANAEEEIDAKYLDMNFLNPFGAWGALTMDGAGDDATPKTTLTKTATHGTTTLTEGPKQPSEPDGLYGGHYTTYIIRDGATLTVYGVLTTETDTWTFTYTDTSFTTESLAARLVGNPFWVDGITANLGTFTKTTKA